jgi:hypothetical protein
MGIGGAEKDQIDQYQKTNSSNDDLHPFKQCSLMMRNKYQFGIKEILDFSAAFLHQGFNLKESN